MTGLYFLRRSLLRQFNPGITAITILFIYAATNVFYYLIDKNSYSHVYLFFLFSFLIFHQKNFFEKPSFKNSLLFFIPLFLALLIRPTSVFIIPLLVFFDVRTRDHFQGRIKQFGDSALKILPAFILSFIVFIPQLIYWKYTSGSFLTWSYGEEGFSNLSNPSIPEFLFSPSNGLFLYTPAFIIILAGLVFYVKQSLYNTALLITFFILIYLFSSWHDSSFGCSYGSRSMVEFYAFFSIILAQLLADLQKRRKIFTQIILYCSLMYFSFVNIKTTYEYDDCYYGEKWDFNQYFKIIRLY